jgi:hypothetical protein
VPVSANFCMSADDIAYAWLNSNPLNSGSGFPGATSTASVVCVNVPMAYFDLGGKNVLAIRNPNTITGFVWASWALDMTCSDGSHTYQTNEMSNVLMYNQPTSASPPPANDGGGLTWYHRDYNNLGTWVAPTGVTWPDALYFKPATNPATGLPLVPGSYVSTAGNHPGNADESPAGEVLFFRQEFSFLQPIAITKTISKTVLALGETFTYCFNYSNPEGVARTFNLWDTIPYVTDFVGCDHSCTTQTYGSNVVVNWSISVPSNGSGSVCMWVAANRYP